MTLFQTGKFTLHSGKTSHFKINCDALSDADLTTIAYQLSLRLDPFGRIAFVPTGGKRLSDAFVPFRTPELLSDWLIVDDVFTTGGSMYDAWRRIDKEEPVTVQGAVIFARGSTPTWVTPLFRLEP